MEYINRFLYFKCKKCLNTVWDVTCNNCVEIDEVESIKYNSCNWMSERSELNVIKSSY